MGLVRSKGIEVNIMEKWIITALADGYYGKDTHVDPLKAVKGISAEEARKTLGKGIHSIWDHLFHMMFWHEVTVNGIQDKDIDWKSIQGKDWPSPEILHDDSNWVALVSAFEKSLEEAKKILKTMDLSKPVRIWKDQPTGRGMLVLVQHNSYHIGQIVVLRQLMGLWPP